jgi:hypothetical protein
LRRALGDGQGSHRYVVTVPGRGYNFVTPVRLEEPPPGAATPAWVCFDSADCFGNSHLGTLQLHRRPSEGTDLNEPDLETMCFDSFYS